MKIEEAKIVIADDNLYDREIIEKDLSYGGINVTRAFEDGTDIWEYILNNPDKVDLVILDKLMPVMSGIEVIQKMKSNPTLANIPIIIETGDAEIYNEYELKECKNAGVFSIIIKPFLPDEIISNVKTALNFA